ncbi:MAG TPA: hypothetical protein GYA07_01615 [Verrucomicrobia bacterium]|nr:hypothetical protein [Verrucomicrobiota bacterium]HPU55730.1 hypothetical protein [Verrucomicrobiota bacterium]
MKDRMTEQVALAYLNGNLLAPYGRATRLEIHSADRRLRIEVELRGETAPLEVEIGGYDISCEGERYFIGVKEVRTSREWLTAMARDQFGKGPLEVPASAGRWLMKLLR